MTAQAGRSAVADVTVIAPKEEARLDADALKKIYGALGWRDAEAAVIRAMEELAIVVVTAEEDWRAGAWDRLDAGLRQVVEIGRQIGLTGLVRVARDARACLAAGDGVALAATVARMSRMAERSLVALWDRG